tara:strand:+ start:177 stop:704 length:528 start_codon:yes stop_codon:yes gene_type:complete
MVKNTTGGGRTKGLARKHQRAQQTSSHLRIPEEEGEEIGYIKKMLGNGMCEIYNNDNVRLIGHIRNKFRGRQKRHNTIQANDIVLIGLRLWESTKKNCDILTIYDDNDINQLKVKPDIKMDTILQLQSENTRFSSKESELEFVEETEEELANTLKQSAELQFELEETDDINMDDI